MPFVKRGNRVFWRNGADEYPLALDIAPGAKFAPVWADHHAMHVELGHLLDLVSGPGAETRAQEEHEPEHDEHDAQDEPAGDDGERHQDPEHDEQNADDADHG